jgi:hypothetical protein
MHTPRARVALALLLCAGCAGACGPAIDSVPGSPTTAALAGPTGEAGLGGPGLPQQLEGERYAGARRDLAGTVELADNGCVNVVLDGRSLFVIWPAGSALDNVVRLPDGDVLADGDRVIGTGALSPVAPLVADRGGYWANVIGFCDPTADLLVVFDSARKR